jgi:D-3-phosphoglycerate dehydrogenase / 2-oxoglutarate reductase
VSVGSPLPPIWFERPILEEFAAEVAASCTVLGPATADDPYVGLATAVGLVAGPRQYDGAFMDRAPNLKVIARTGIGVDAVDVAAATERGIAVCNTPDGPTISTAEHAVALMVFVAKNVGAAQAALRTGRSDGYFATHRGIELSGKVLGLVGLGRIGRHVAHIAHGLGMEVRFFDPFVGESDVPAGVVRVEALGDLLAAADVVSLHLPLTGSSRGMFGADQFASMKPGAIFINTARGGLVDQDSLLATLEAGRLFGAGLDVTSPEPLPPDHPLLHREDVVVTPHIASATAEGKARMFEIAFRGAIAVIEGRRPEHLVNPEVWERSFTATEAGVGT